MNLLGIGQPSQPKTQKTPPTPKKPEKKPLLSNFFESCKKEFGKMFENSFLRIDSEKKKEAEQKIKAICGSKTKMVKGEFNYEKYLALCLLFEIQPQQFEDFPKVIDVQIVDSKDQIESAIKIAELLTDSEKQTSSKDLVATKQNLVSRDDQTEKRLDSTVEKPLSSFFGKKISIDNKVKISDGELRDSFDSQEPTSANDDDKFGNTKEDYNSREKQTGINSNSNPSLKKPSKLVPDFRIEIKEQSFSADQEGEKLASASDFGEPDNFVGQTQIKHESEKKPEIPKKTNKKTSRILSSGNQKKQPLSGPNTTLTIEFPET
jgi:hypothetical protein